MGGLCSQKLPQFPQTDVDSKFSQDDAMVTYSSSRHRKGDVSNSFLDCAQSSASSSEASEYSETNFSHTVRVVSSMLLSGR